jgi:drug/metabolite transporter (DMT)-like permease
LTNRNIIAVLLWMAGALLSFSATAVGIRELAGRLSLFEILSVRNAGGLVILLAVAALRGDARAGFRARRLPLHGLRNLIHWAATFAWALGVTLLPLATVFSLEFTMPAWVAVLAVLILKERMTPSRAVQIGLGFLGVLVILRPGLAALNPAALVVLASALGFALTTIATKKLITSETTFSILVWMNLMQLPLNLLGSEWGFWSRLDMGAVLPLLAVAIGGLTSHFCLTNAYRHGDAIIVQPLDFLRIPLIAFVGWTFYAEPLDPFVFLGSALIIGGIVWNLRAEARR